MNGDALFVRDGDGYTATALADGPWAEGALHGGAPAALLTHVIAHEFADTGLRIGRLTYEFVRPAPRGPLHPRIEVLRPGRRVTLLDATLSSGEEIVTRARALLVAPAAFAAGTQDETPFGGPETGEAQEWRLGRPTLATDGMETTFVDGYILRTGPATVWFRLRQPLVAGEPTLAADRIAAVADFPNGIGSELDWSRHSFINPDLTVVIERDPVDEWVALRARMRVAEGSVATAEGELFDRRGRIGRCVQTLIVGPAAGAT